MLRHVLPQLETGFDCVGRRLEELLGRNIHFVGLDEFLFQQIILGFIVITVRYTYMWFNSVERYNAQLHVVDTLAAQSPDGRQAVATNLLWLHSQGLAPDALDDSTFRWMLGAVERTGSGGWTTTDPLSWSPFIHSWVLAWIACTAVACSLMLGLVYYWDCKDRHHYLADLP